MSAEPDAATLTDQERAELRELLLDGMASPLVAGTAQAFLTELDAELDRRHHRG